MKAIKETNTGTNRKEDLVLSMAKFFNDYSPIKNHIDKNSSFDELMFETFGKEHKFVRGAMNNKAMKVWTLINEGEENFVMEGYHFVNRLGYFITKSDIPAKKVTGAQ